MFNRVVEFDFLVKEWSNISYVSINLILGAIWGGALEKIDWNSNIKGGGTHSATLGRMSVVSIVFLDVVAYASSWLKHRDSTRLTEYFLHEVNVLSIYLCFPQQLKSKL